jgi:hypothetical protein
LGKAEARRAREHCREAGAGRGFYGDLRRPAEGRGLSAPAPVEEMFKSHAAPSAATYTGPGAPARAGPGKAAPSKPVQVALWQEDPLWILIRAGEGPHAVEISLNRLQLAKLCNAGLLAEEVCAKAREAAKRG